MTSKSSHHSTTCSGSSPIRGSGTAPSPGSVTRSCRILGQPHGRLDLREVMTRAKGISAAAALDAPGSLLVTSLQLAAISCSDIPEVQRRDFFVYVDEFQNFATDSFATILFEARKYRSEPHIGEPVSDADG